MERISSRLEGERTALSREGGRQEVCPCKVRGQSSPGADGEKEVVPQAKGSGWPKSGPLPRPCRSRDPPGGSLSPGGSGRAN